MKICLAQLNPCVADFEGNFEKAKKAFSIAGSQGADLIVFPELYVTGYPPKDLLEDERFLRKIEVFNEKYKKLGAGYGGLAAVLGTVTRNRSGKGKRLFNSVLVVANGEEIFFQAKSLLPFYDVFDEGRYFEPSEQSEILVYKDKKIGLTVCEDAWSESGLWGDSVLYDKNPVKELKSKDAELIINISASPFSAGKTLLRKKVFGDLAKKYGILFMHVNQVGANDELIFDGNSSVFACSSDPVLTLASFEEEIGFFDTDDISGVEKSVLLSETEEIFTALKLGVKDYFRKCGFERAVIGLSGGIDSAVTACIAVEALGKDNVVGITMPSKYSSEGSVEDSRILASNLGIKFHEISIEEIYDSYLASLDPFFSGKKFDSTEENIQARIRGNLLMAFSNKFGSIVLSTGNKSELAVGYCTLYGDMSGGLAVLSDVFKTTVYQLSNYINRTAEIIPQSIIEKPPSAELRPAQKDQDTLPPYEILDDILKCYLEEKMKPEEIAGRGHKKKTVEWVLQRVFQNEYKRQQAALGLKISEKAFGFGRRMPIAARYFNI
ncbi:NAD+ synthase [candidate division WOR-3 bacterium]|nr:NAD+ synthase [candidate division WOR-3 bacterium]